MVVDAVWLSRKLKAEKVAVFGEIASVVGIDSDIAAEIKDIIDTLIPAEVYDGYIVLDGEFIVFRRDRKIFMIVVIEEDRVRWCLNKMREILT